MRIDPERDDFKDLEYLIEDPCDVSVTGVLFRKFGHGVDENIFGHLPKRLDVKNPEKEPKVEYRWTKLLEEEYRKLGLFVEIIEEC